MNQLTKFLINELVDGKPVTAVFGGGFKPPVRGHFQVVKDALKEYKDIDKFIIYVGGGERDGITQEQSLKIWEIYKELLPSKVEIVPSSAPIGDIIRYIKDHPKEEVYFIIGYREGRDDDLADVAQRTKGIEEKYPNAKVRVISSTDLGMSGTNARKALMKGDKEKFFTFLPYEVPNNEKEEIYNIVGKSVIKENNLPSIDILQKIEDLTNHMRKKGYKIDPTPRIELIDNDVENAKKFLGKTAYYDPTNKSIILYTYGRHPKDIVRSFAHEMIHHIQNLEGRLGDISTTNTLEDDHINDLEKEANLKGTMTFRNWTDSLQEDLTQEVPPYLYHATYKPLLKKIKERGLDTNDSKKAWDDSIPGYVYLSLDPYVAESYAEESEMVPESWVDNIIILKVDTSKLDKSKLFIDQNVQGNEGDTLEYRGVIPWSALKLYKEDLDENKNKDPFGLNQYARELAQGLEEIEDKEIKFWALYNDLFKILKTNPEQYDELSNKLEGEKLDALNYFWNFLEKGTINEVGEANLKPYKWEEVDWEGYFVYTRFTTESGTQYDLDIETTTFKDDDGSEYPAFGIEFSAKPKDAGGSSSRIVVNKGEMYRVMSTITSIIKYYLGQSRKKIKAIKYSPSKKSGEDFGTQRDNLYKAFISKAMPGAKFKTSGEHTIALLPEIINEGVYDSIVTKLSREVLTAWKSQFDKDPKLLFALLEGNYELRDAKGRPLEFEFIAKLDFKKTKDRKYKVNGGADEGDDETEGFVALNFQIDPRSLPQMWETISMDIRDVLRHEIEHLTQGGWNVRPGKNMEDDTAIRDLIQKYKTLAPKNYFLLDKEIEAMLQGLYFKARKSHKTFEYTIDQYLDRVGLKPEEKEEIKNIWAQRAKSLSLPQIPRASIKNTSYIHNTGVNENDEEMRDALGTLGGKKKVIYCDMDGVLVDFDKGFHELTGLTTHHADSQNKDEFWDIFRKGIQDSGKTEEEYWANLEWMPDGKQLWDYIKPYHPYLLSAPSVNIDIPFNERYKIENNESMRGKTTWAQRLDNLRKLYFKSASRKADFAHPNQILIDDKQSTIDAWNSNGGIGIFHTSAADTIKQLKELGI